MNTTINHHFSRIEISFCRYNGLRDIKGLGFVHYENDHIWLSEKILGNDCKDEVMAVIEANRAIIEEVNGALDWDGMLAEASKEFAMVNAYGKYGKTAGKKVALDSYYPFPLRAEGTNVFGVLKFANVVVGK